MRRSGLAGQGWRLLVEPSDGLVETWTEVDGRPVRALTKGQQSDLSEMVIIPGMGAPSYVFPWAQEIARWTRVSVLDLPGWRWGRGRSSPSTVEGVAVATARWLEVTDRRNVVLIGHSSGSQSAIRTAHLAPERLSGLVLAGPTLDPEARNLATLAARLFDTVVNERLSEFPDILPWYIASGGLPWLRLARSVVTDRPEDHLTTMPFPVVVLTGESDRFSPPAWAQHLARLAAAEFHVLPGAHNACFTSPCAADAVLHRTVLVWTKGEDWDRTEGGW